MVQREDQSPVATTGTEHSTSHDEPCRIIPRPSVPLRLPTPCPACPCPVDEPSLALPSRPIRHASPCPIKPPRTSRRAKFIPCQASPLDDPIPASPALPSPHHPRPLPTTQTTFLPALFPPLRRAQPSRPSPVPSDYPIHSTRLALPPLALPPRPGPLRPPPPTPSSPLPRQPVLITTCWLNILNERSASMVVLGHEPTFA